MLETALDILKEIEKSGFKAYIVGGYPRNRYLDLPTMDIDICTSAKPKDLKNIFTDIKLPVEQYGSVLLIRNKIHFEITTFRKDIKYKDGRHPVKIKYIDSLLEDLQRRDFTINTLCIDSNGDDLDLLNAKGDIDLKVIKTVGSSKVKLREDALRILRAIRFATTLDFELEEDLKKYIRKYGSRLKKLSYNRKQEELNKIFSSPNVLKGLKLIKDLKLDKPLEISGLSSIKKTSSLLGIWAQLKYSDKYMFSNHELETIEAIKKLVNEDLLSNDNLYNYGLYISTIAGEIKGTDRKEIIQKYNDLAITNSKEIVLKPDEICDILEVKPGPFLKPLLSDLECQIVNNKLKNTKIDLKEYILNNKSTYI